MAIILITYYSERIPGLFDVPDYHTTGYCLSHFSRRQVVY